MPVTEATTESDSAKESKRERRRRSRASKTAGTSEVRLKVRTPEGRVFTMTGRVIDVSDYGVGVESDEPLPVGAKVDLAGPFFQHSPQGRSSAKGSVIHCRMENGNLYRAGIALDEEEEARDGSASAAASSNGSFVDYYEVLQLSPNASAETIHRVYRIFAQRFHPDNPDTGDVETFRTILQAYRVLSEPEKRAAYDVSYHSSRSLKWKIFSVPEDGQAHLEEDRKRYGVLALLLRKRREEPLRPGMSPREMEEMLDCPREHLEFTLWYLKSKGWIVVEDNARYAVTVEGVDAAEELSKSSASKDLPPLLEAARPGAAEPRPAG